MGSRRRFRPRPTCDEPRGDAGAKGERSCGSDRPTARGPFNKAPRREREGEGFGLNPSLLEPTAEKSPGGSASGVRTGNRHRWARRAASGARVRRGQGTRHNGPVTSEEGTLSLGEGI